VLAERLNAGSMADFQIPVRPSWCNEEGGFEPNAVAPNESRRKGKDKQNDVRTLIS
jgi:hypothetical protein